MSSYNGFVKLRRGLEEHFQKDNISYFDAGLYIRLILSANYSTGVVYIRKKELHSERFCSLEQVRRALDRLEEKQYIKTFRQRGSKNRFAVLINKHQRAEDGKMLNALKSTSPKDLVWEDANVMPMSCQGGANDVPMSEAQNTENKELARSKELRSKELKEKREEEMRANKQIPILSLQILGVKAEKWENTWAEVKELTDAFSQQAVIDAFETWARSQDPDKVTKPVSAFLNVAPGILRGIRTGSINPAAKQLILDLSYMSKGDVTFGQKQADEIARLLNTYTIEDIKVAFTDFLGKLDESSLKFAGKDFSEKAEQLIHNIRKHREELDNIELMRKQIDAAEATKVAENVKEVENQTEEIDELPTA